MPKFQEHHQQRNHCHDYQPHWKRCSSVSLFSHKTRVYLISTYPGQYSHMLSGNLSNLLKQQSRWKLGYHILNKRHATGSINPHFLSIWTGSASSEANQKYIKTGILCRISGRMFAFLARNVTYSTIHSVSVSKASIQSRKGFFALRRLNTNRCAPLYLIEDSFIQGKLMYQRNKDKND